MQKTLYLMHVRDKQFYQPSMNCFGWSNVYSQLSNNDGKVNARMETAIIWANMFFVQSD